MSEKEQEKHPTPAPKLGAFVGFQNGIAEFLGYGTKTAEVPEGDACIPRSTAARFAENKRSHICLKLDNGDTVFESEATFLLKSDSEDVLTRADKVKNVRVADIREARRAERSCPAKATD